MYWAFDGMGQACSAMSKQNKHLVCFNKNKKVSISFSLPSKKDIEEADNHFKIYKNKKVSISFSLPLKKDIEEPDNHFKICNTNV